MMICVVFRIEEYFRSEIGERVKKLKITIYVFLAAALVLAAVTLFEMTEILLCGRDTISEPVDAAIVLGAAAWGNNPSPVFRERINHGVDLYKKGLCRYVIITGGKGFPEEPGESVIGRKYAAKNGVPASAILIENYSRNTEQNIRYAKIIAMQHDIKSYALVSDPYHLKRAMLMAQDKGMDVRPSATPTSRYRSFDAKMHFLFKEVYFITLYRIQRATGIELTQVIDDLSL